MKRRQVYKTLYDIYLQETLYLAHKNFLLQYHKLHTHKIYIALCVQNLTSYNQKKNMPTHMKHYTTTYKTYMLRLKNVCGKL